LDKLKPQELIFPSEGVTWEDDNKKLIQLIDSSARIEYVDCER